MSNFPSGTIVLWSGSIANIPAGWIICNGGGGSPDLRNRFLVGAGDTYAVDAVGGAINHNHAFTGDGHVHDIDIGADISSGGGYDNLTDSAQAEGTTDNGNGLPPYHALAYIMKT